MIKQSLIASILSLGLIYPPAIIADAPKDNTPAEVQDLRYGVILYHFFQQSYFEAITEILVGEQLNDMPYHQESAQLLRGGMSLSYGMGQQAEVLFNQLLATLNSPQQRDQAWFYLGKLFYTHRQRDQARAALANINEPLSPDLQDEYLFLTANLLLHADKADLANDAIAELAPNSPWLAYYYFNRGSTETLSGQWQLGVESFQQVVTLPIGGEEGATLKDRALIASGFARLGGSDFDQAISDFIKVRLNSPLVDQALLGYGWAAAQQENFQQALSPWQALSKRSMMSSSVQESLLAIPYAYEKLGAPASALAQYQNAVAVFEQEQKKLSEAIAVFTNKPMMELVNEDAALGSDWISGHDYLPVNSQAPYLAHLIAQDHFQSAIKDFSDLMRIQQYLQQAADRSSSMQSVLEVQRVAWQESLNKSQREAYQDRYKKLLDSRTQLTALQVLAAEKNNGQRLINKQELELWNIANNASELIAELKKAGQDVSTEQEQLRLFKGLLVWQANEKDSARQWQLKSELKTINSLLDETNQRLARIEKFTANRYDSKFADRVLALDERLQKHYTDVELAIFRADEEIRQLAIVEFEKQQQRLAYYLGQAKLAIARLYDAGSEGAIQ